MNFNKILRSLFGDKSSRDMKLIQPLVEKVKAVYPEVQKLDNDQLRQRTKDIQRQVQDSALKEKEEIEKLKATIEDTPIDERADIFAQID
jgi:preprotein translocase subunit SecA